MHAQSKYTVDRTDDAAWRTADAEIKGELQRNFERNNSRIESMLIQIAHNTDRIDTMEREIGRIQGFGGAAMVILTGLNILGLIRKPQ